MEWNQQFWRSEGQTFFQRFRLWADILDPLVLFSSAAEIEKSRELLQASGSNIKESLQDKKIKEAWKISLASVHPGTGEVIPIIFRPPVFQPWHSCISGAYAASCVWDLVIEASSSIKKHIDINLLAFVLTLTLCFDLLMVLVDVGHNPNQIFNSELSCPLPLHCRQYLKRYSFSLVHEGMPLPRWLLPSGSFAIGTFLSHKGVRRTFIWQLLFHSYIGGFNFANGNFTRTETENVTTEANVFHSKQLLLSFGAISYSACVGTLPQYLLTRYKLQGPSAQLIFTKIVPAPLTGIERNPNQLSSTDIAVQVEHVLHPAVGGQSWRPPQTLLCAFNVMVIRGGEFENGIEVIDSNGKVVGFSLKAGEKAVKETALSRIAMFGTALVIPDIVLHLLQRTSVLLRNPLALSSLRSILMISLLGAMIPVSFSWKPQMGKIHRSELEPALVSTTEETDFFYNRGV